MFLTGYGYLGLGVSAPAGDLHIRIRDQEVATAGVVIDGLSSTSYAAAVAAAPLGGHLRTPVNHRQRRRAGARELLYLYRERLGRGRQHPGRQREPAARRAPILCSTRAPAEPGSRRCGCGPALSALGSTAPAATLDIVRNAAVQLRLASLAGSGSTFMAYSTGTTESLYRHGQPHLFSVGRSHALIRASHRGRSRWGARMPIPSKSIARRRRGSSAPCSRSMRPAMRKRSKVAPSARLRVPRGSVWWGGLKSQPLGNGLCAKLQSRRQCLASALAEWLDGQLRRRCGWWRHQRVGRSLRPIATSTPAIRARTTWASGRRTASRSTTHLLVVGNIYPGNQGSYHLDYTAQSGRPDCVRESLVLPRHLPRQQQRQPAARRTARTTCVATPANSRHPHQRRVIVNGNIYWGYRRELADRLSQPGRADRESARRSTVNATRWHLHATFGVSVRVPASVSAPGTSAVLPGGVSIIGTTVTSTASASFDLRIAVHIP